MYKVGSIQKKILLTFLGGVSLGLSRSPKQYFYNFKALRREWKNVDQQSFNRSIQGLAKNKLLVEKKLANGSIKMVLTEDGKLQAKKLSILGNSIKFKKPKKWDKKWRIVIFDIPEKNRMFRSILRNHLKDLHFKKLQNSVFVAPYPFEKSILDLVSLYQAEKYVRVITAIKINNEVKLKHYFFKKK
ncbi:MAG TPA: hypothetical protein ENJ27_01475 [Candidatus Moranbacteria bacterium]|nr:hypothetical protein [Candidatus Moranbacteria bacterium]